MSAQAMSAPVAFPAANPLPTSAEIIGFLVKRLELDLGPGIKERTWRNYIAGKPVSEKTRDAIFDALARAFLSPKGDLSLPDGQVVSAEEGIRGIREVLMAQARHWDDIRTRLPAGASPKTVPLLAIVALRLVIIDLALRCAVFLANLEGLEPSKEPQAPEAPDSTPSLEENLLGRLLRELLKLASLTRDELAEKLEVSKQAVDKWLDGRDLPPRERIEEIVDIVVQRTGTTQDTLPVRFLLRGLRLLAKVTHPLEACIGPKQFEQLGLGFLRLTRAVWRQLAHLSFPSKNRQQQVYGEIVLIGSHSIFGQHILRMVARQEQDIVWTGLVRAAAMDWARTLAAIQEAASRLAHIEQIVDTEGLRHMDLEAQAESSLVIAFAPPEVFPDFLVRMFEAPPELRAQMIFYCLGLRLEGVREMPDGPEKLLELARLSESCRLAATTSPWEPESFNRLAWTCHSLRLAYLFEPFEKSLIKDWASLVQACREVRAAFDEAPRVPPPADLFETQESMAKLRASFEAIFGLVEAINRGELKLVEGELIRLPEE